MATTAATYVDERRGWRTGHTAALGAIVAAIGVIGVVLPRTSGGLFFLGGRTVLAWLLIAGLMGAFAAVAGHGVTGLARGVLIDERHRITLGRLQMLLWTILVLSAYMAAALANIGRGSRTPLEVSIPNELWLTMGISTGLALGDMLDESTAPFTALPAVDEGVVTLLAISHAGYLSRKALPIGAPAPAKPDGDG